MQPQMIESTGNLASRRSPAAPAACLALFLLLAGCGQSGPLYLPEEPAATDGTGAPAEPEQKDDDAENSRT